MLELTCSFQQNIEAANIRKKTKYQDLKEDLEKTEFHVTLLPFEIGSRGQVTKRNRTALENICKVNNIKLRTKQLYKNKIALLCSYFIFYAQSQPTWTSPPYISPQPYPDHHTFGLHCGPPRVIQKSLVCARVSLCNLPYIKYKCTLSQKSPFENLLCKRIHSQTV